jgi:hypothetical protein
MLSDWEEYLLWAETKKHKEWLVNNMMTQQGMKNRKKVNN